MLSVLSSAVLFTHSGLQAAQLSKEGVPPLTLLQASSLHTRPCLPLSQLLGYPVRRVKAMTEKSLLRNWTVTIQVVTLSQHRFARLGAGRLEEVIMCLTPGGTGFAVPSTSW